LSIEIGHPVARIGQARERQPLALPVFPDTPSIFRANYQDLGIPVHELRVVLAQLCQMRAAKRSAKAAVEHQYDIPGASKVGQSHGLSLGIGQGEIRRHFGTW
jgi:hypothetical protein